MIFTYLILIMALAILGLSIFTYRQQTKLDYELDELEKSIDRLKDKLHDN